MSDRRPTKLPKRTERPAGGSYARRDRRGTMASPRRRVASTPSDIRADRDGIAGEITRDDLEDAIYAREIDRRLSDPDAARPIPWDQAKRNLGL